MQPFIAKAHFPTLIGSLQQFFPLPTFLLCYYILNTRYICNVTCHVPEGDAQFAPNVTSGERHRIRVERERIRIRTLVQQQPIDAARRKPSSSRHAVQNRSRTSAALERDCRRAPIATNKD